MQGVKVISIRLVSKYFDFLSCVSILYVEIRHTFILQEMRFGWRIVIGSILGFFGAACGSAGGVGGAGTFILMLTVIIGFDAKTSTALSKCKRHLPLLLHMTAIPVQLQHIRS